VPARPIIDHIFICTAPGAPAAELLIQAGLGEGPSNRHPGQGTACRRFFFSNFMLELIWLENAAEARSPQTRATRLWERLSGAGPDASPFGIILKPQPDSDPACPFRSWNYRPPTMPGLDLEIAADTDIREPMWCWMKTPFARSEPLDHPAGYSQLTAVLIHAPAVPETSVTAAMAAAGVIALEPAADHLLELQFDSGRRATTLDLRPALPLILHA
jgi:hypothetical protein